MRASEFITERRKRRRPRYAAYGPGPYGGYGYLSGYSGDSGGDGGGGGESIEQKTFEHRSNLDTTIQGFVNSPSGKKYKAHDCKTVTRAFVTWAEQNKIPTQVVSLAPPSADFIAKNPRYKGKSGEGDGHIMPIVNGNAIDFTIRQFGVNRPFNNPLVTPTSSLPAVYGKFGYFTDKPEWFLGGKSHWIGALNSIPSEIFNQNFGDELLEQGVAEGATITRIDSKPITDFGSSLKAYKHTDDWSQSGVDTGDDSYWKNKNLKTNTTKGLFAGDPKRTALYATGNAHETRYVEFTQDGQPIVYFDRKDLPAMRSRKTYLTVFDANDFRQLPTGEWFSENPGKPIKQIPIGDPFKYIASQGWIVRVTDDLDKVFKQVKNMHKAGKIAQYGAEGMNESKQGVAENFADGRNPQDKGDSQRHGVNTKASVSSLRKTAKQGGRKGQLAHWLANMKAGRAKKK